MGKAEAVVCPTVLEEMEGMEESIAELNEGHWKEFWFLRERLFRELGEFPVDAAALEKATMDYYLAHINRDLFSWGVFSEKRLVSAGSLCLFERLPYEGNLAGREGYILNIYTLPHYRRQGFAGRILDKIFDYASSAGVKRLWLNSSREGEKLYTDKGFRQGKANEMELVLP